MTSEEARDEPTLCVDLDKTLARGDSMVRLGMRLALTRPWLLPAMAWWALRGRAHLKDEVARRVAIDAASFAYHRGLLDWLRQEKARGRRLALASGSDRRVVAAVAEHLGLFDDILGSDGTTNLTGPRKAAALAARFGVFDYVGDSPKDRAVWRQARRRYLVARGPRLGARLGREVDFTRVFAPDWARH